MNLCQQCFNERRAQQGEPRLNSWQWRAVVENKAHRGRIWRIMGNEQVTRGVADGDEKSLDIVTLCRMSAAQHYDVKLSWADSV